MSTEKISISDIDSILKELDANAEGILLGLRTAMLKAGCDPCQVSIGRWWSQQAWHDAWGLHISAPDDIFPRVEAWVRAWVKRENDKAKYCSDDRSFYILKVGAVWEELPGVMTMNVATGSRQLGD